MTAQSVSGRGLTEVSIWGDGASWREANDTLEYLVRRHKDSLTEAKRQAKWIRQLLDGLFPDLNDLCRQTCPRCPVPCCKVAKVWADFRDLTFFHLNGIAPPEAQLIRRLSDACRYLGPDGCVLDRSARPWVCTWYICPAQKALLTGRRDNAFGRIDRIIREIKIARVDMEAAFISAIF